MEIKVILLLKVEVGMYTDAAAVQACSNASVMYYIVIYYPAKTSTSAYIFTKI
jgi:hypothetical protein